MIDEDKPGYYERISEINSNCKNCSSPIFEHYPIIDNNGNYTGLGSICYKHHKKVEKTNPEIAELSNKMRLKIFQNQIENDFEKRYYDKINNFLQQTSYMDKMRERSGHTESNNKLVAFLYTLMRDYLPCGIIEEIMIDNEPKNSDSDNKFVFTNGWLANYSKDIAERLK